MLLLATVPLPAQTVAGQERIPRPAAAAEGVVAVRDGAERDGTLPDSKASDSVEQEKPAIEGGYGGKDFRVGTTDGNGLLHGEFRYAYPFVSNPITFQKFSEGDKSTLKIIRARLKVGGNGYRPRGMITLGRLVPASLAATVVDGLSQDVAPYSLRKRWTFIQEEK